MQKWIPRIFVFLVCASLLAPFFVFKDLLFPFVTSKAFFFRIVIELALPFYIYLLIKDPQFRPSWKNPLTISLVLFWLFTLVSALVGVGVLKSLWGNFERMGGVYYITHLVLLYFYVLSTGKAYPNFLKRILQTLIAVAVLTTLNGIFTKIGWLSIISDPSLPGRVSSTFGNPIFFASFLILTLFVTIFFALREEGVWAKSYYWVAAVLQMIGIFLSATRGAEVGLILGLFIAAWVYVFLAPRRIVKIYGLGILIVGTLIVAALFANSSKFTPGTALYRLTHLKDSNSEARLIQWQTALKGYVHRPFFGTGPENYYVISNEYFNPVMYKYDGSWFDKPHNYLLEILVTQGAFAFVSYLAMLVFAVWGIYKAYKAQYLGLLEMTVLLAGLLAYQIQNLFVFDTVSASLAFYVFFGFCGFFVESVKTTKKEAGKKNSYNFDQTWPNVAFVASLIGVVVLVYLTNWLPVLACKATNYGYAYGSAGPGNAQKGEQYFEDATSNQFNFDPGETASRYEDAAVQIINNSSAYPQDLVSKVMDNSLSAMEAATEKIPDNPIYWQKLGALYLAKSYMQKQLDSHALPAIQKAIDLAPKRTEAKSLLVQMYLAKSDNDNAIKLAEQIYHDNPSVTTNEWQLAVVYSTVGRTEDAAKLMDDLVQKKYPLNSYNQVSWLAAYYEKQKNYPKAVNLLEYVAANGSQDYELYFRLGVDLLQIGDKDTAKKAAQAALQLNPPDADKTVIQQFIDSIK